MAASVTTLLGNADEIPRRSLRRERERERKKEKKKNFKIEEENRN